MFLKINKPVAVLSGDVITFGQIARISTITDETGESTEVLVRFQNSSRSYAEDMLADVPAGQAYTEFDKLVQQSVAYKWACGVEEEKTPVPAAAEAM